MSAYYIDAAGDNENSGESELLPWATIAHAQGELTGDQSDNSLLFKCGCTWREEFADGAYGTSGHPFTISSYSTGAKPIITASDLFASWTAEDVLWYATTATEPQQVFYDGPRLVQVALKASLGAGKWWWDSANTRIYIGSDPSGHALEAGQRYGCLDFNGKSYVTVDGLTLKHGQRDGLDLYTSSYLIINNCLIEYNYIWGVLQDANGTKNNYNTFHGNEVCYNGGNGMANVGNTDGLTVCHNEFHHNCCLYDSGVEASGHEWTGAIRSLNSSCTNIVIEYNLIHDNGRTDTYWCGAGVWFDGCGAGCIVRYNRLYDNKFHGIHPELTSGAAVYGNVVSGTHGLDGHVAGICIYGRFSEAPSNNNLIYNNSVYGNDIGILVRGETGQNASVVGNLVKNNISSGNTVCELSTKLGGENDGSLGSGNVYEYNCFGAEGSNFIEWGDTVFKATYDAWETAYGGTTHSIEADPLFTNPAGGDFTLQAASPCIDTGVDLGATYQMALRPGTMWPGQ
jgi:hypothetical protein